MLRSTRWLQATSCTIKAAIRPSLWRRSLAGVTDGAPPLIREEAVRLRQYQEECIQSVLSYLKNGHKRLGISLATGSGKTVIFTQLIDRVSPEKAAATKTLILAHRRELVEQAARHCTRAYPEKSIEIEMGDQHASGEADITIASVRSLQMGRLEKYDPYAFKLVLVDEAHHIVAPGYLEVLDHFGLDQPRSDGPALVGVSATFSRFDGLRLGAAIDHIVYHKDYVDMIGEKWLCDVKFTTVKSGANLSRAKSNKDGDFAISQLSSAVNNDEINDLTVKSWFEEAGTRKSTLVFCVDLNHVASLTDTFRKYGIDARYITGETGKTIRSERLEAFKNREFPVLLNCGVFTEGTDMPNVDCVLLARPTKSRNLLVQMIGRGMRLYPDKKDCHVIDMVASLETGIVTVPTLFGLDPSEVVKDASSGDLKALKETRIAEGNSDDHLYDSTSASRDPAKLKNKELTFIHYDTVHDLIEDTSGERHVRAISANAWVQVDSDRFILTAKGGILTLERRHLTAQELAKLKKLAPPQTSASPSADEDDTTTTTTNVSPTPDPDPGSDPTAPPLYHVTYKYSLPATAQTQSPWSKPRHIASASTLTAALHSADTFAASKFERVFIASSSSWRRAPASSSQLAFLNKLRGAAQRPLTGDDLTKGRAGDMIAKIKFGARGRFDKMMVRRRKVARAVERERELRERERVEVGPLAA